jgi:hypothetical protein
MTTNESAVIRFSATVNGETRHVDIDADNPFLARWSVAWTDGVTQDGVPDADDLESIETTVMNTEHFYREFYAGASRDDLAAELLDITAEAI